VEGIVVLWRGEMIQPREELSLAVNGERKIRAVYETTSTNGIPVESLTLLAQRLPFSDIERLS
jgi:hypothetical protein